MSDQEKQPGKREVIPLRIDRVEPDPSMAQYTNNLTVSHTEDEFVVTFYRVLLPSSATAENITELDSVHGEPVARLIIPPGKMQGFIDALQRNLEGYLQGKEEGSNAEAEN